MGLLGLGAGTCSLFSEVARLSSSVAVAALPPQQQCGSAPWMLWPHWHSAVFVVFILAVLASVFWYLSVVLIFIFLMMLNIFVCVCFAIHMSSWWIIRSKLFFVFVFCKYFFLSIFILLTVSFAKQKFLISMKANLWISKKMGSSFWCHVGTLPNSKLPRFLLLFYF